MIKNSYNDLNKYFDEYCSNTLCSTANQSFFVSERPAFGRAFYRITNGGQYNYSFLFSSEIDSTFQDGSFSKANDLCDFTIGNLKAYVVRADYFDKRSDKAMELKNAFNLFFGGKSTVRLQLGQCAYTDEITLKAEEGDYICLESTFYGDKIPFFPEALIPVFTFDKKWISDKKVPLAAMIGCNRKAKKKIAFLGDSITQGIGTPMNSYKQWNAITAQLLGKDNAYWNLGIGFGRAADVSTKGIWLYKAAQNDIVFVCFGVNDILQSNDPEQTKKDITFIIEHLEKKQKKIIMQSVPPFNFEGAYYNSWKELNNYLKDFCDEKHLAFFDNTELLTQGKNISKYGPHPNAEGCRIWGEQLYNFVSQNKLI